ncbi:hypothetical protein LIF_A2810 [Leptospira interrogans serovar Lai str. IPAV]|nr:hypothetical protein LIF_A2810 [Leptospira interrogans serovar Lai str. IPAV]
MKTQHNALYESRWKLNTTLSYGSRWKTQHNAFLWVALENSTQRFPMGRVGKLNTTLFMNRVGKLNTTLFMNRVGKLNTTLFMNRVGKLNTTLFMNRVGNSTQRSL